MKQELLKRIQNEVQKVKNEAGEFNLLLSGGVDSSTLLGVALSIGIEPDRIISVRLPYGKAHDEFDDMLKVVAGFGLEHKLMVVSLDDSTIEEVLRKAVKIIGRPIPHYNIFPFYVLFEKLSKIGITSVVVGDGPDESMCGYARHIILKEIYQILGVDGYQEYTDMIRKILPSFVEAYATIINKDVSEIMTVVTDEKTRLNNLDLMCLVDMKLMRPDMMDMSHTLANHFGIRIFAPYEEPRVDEFMFKLDPEWKIKNYYGKYMLRHIATQLGVPKSVAWRRQKIGGPLVPVNKLMGWELSPYDKTRYIEFQKEILNEN